MTTQQPTNNPDLAKDGKTLIRGGIEVTSLCCSMFDIDVPVGGGHVPNQSPCVSLVDLAPENEYFDDCVRRYDPKMKAKDMLKLSTSNERARRLRGARGDFNKYTGDDRVARMEHAARVARGEADGQFRNFLRQEFRHKPQVRKVESVEHKLKVEFAKWRSLPKLVRAQSLPNWDLAMVATGLRYPPMGKDHSRILKTLHVYCARRGLDVERLLAGDIEPNPGPEERPVVCQFFKTVHSTEYIDISVLKANLLVDIYARNTEHSRSVTVHCRFCDTVLKHDVEHGLNRYRHEWQANFPEVTSGTLPYSFACGLRYNKSGLEMLMQEQADKKLMILRPAICAAGQSLGTAPPLATMPPGVVEPGSAVKHENLTVSPMPGLAGDRKGKQISPPPKSPPTPPPVPPPPPPTPVLVPASKESGGHSLAEDVLLEGVQLNEKEIGALINAFVCPSLSYPIYRYWRTYSVEYEYRCEKRIAPNRNLKELKAPMTLCQINVKVLYFIWYWMLLSVGFALAYLMVPFMVPSSLRIGDVHGIIASPFEAPPQGGFNPLTTIFGCLAIICLLFSFRIRSMKFPYVPHLVTSVLNDYDRETNYEVAASTIRMRMRRLGCLPIPDHTYIQLIEGSEAVTLARMAARDYFAAGAALVGLPP